MKRTSIDWFATKVVLLWAGSVAWAVLLGLFAGRT